MKVDYIPLGTLVRYKNNIYQTDSACSRALGTIRIRHIPGGQTKYDGYFVSVADLQECKKLRLVKLSGYMREGILIGG
jgi:hypothetical protein